LICSVLRYFAKSVVLEKKNTMPGKVDKTTQNPAIQGILEQEKFMIRVLFICHGRIDENRVNSFKQGGCCFEVAWFRPNLDQW